MSHKMMQTVRSEINRADSELGSACIAVVKAESLQRKAAEAVADAERQLANANARCRRAEEMARLHGLDHLIPWDGEI